MTAASWAKRREHALIYEDLTRAKDGGGLIKAASSVLEEAKRRAADVLDEPSRHQPNPTYRRRRLINLFKKLKDLVGPIGAAVRGRIARGAGR